MLLLMCLLQFFLFHLNEVDKCLGTHFNKCHLLNEWAVTEAYVNLAEQY